MDLVDRVSRRLTERGLRLGIAESCTGGLLGAALTERPGASNFLVADLVTYSDRAKTRLLGVRPEALAEHGAVSRTVVEEMVRGVLRVSDADAAMAITGVAGPGGGTPAKPVGTVWIAAAVGDEVSTASFRFDGDRAAVRAEAVAAALNLLDVMLSEAE